VTELYPYIGYRNGELEIEGVPASKLAGDFGTPVYVYSEGALKHWFREFDGAFSQVERLVCFAVKACSNINILKVLKELGAGADTVSAGEIFRALTAGISPEKIVFAGVGKRKDEIEYAVAKDILMINVESESELKAVGEVAKKLSKTAQIAVRVNPLIDPKTHPYISTALKTSKFGVPAEEALKLYREALNIKSVKPVGIHFHIGSQVSDVSAFGKAVKAVAELAGELKSMGVELLYLDAGGGLAINYDPKERPVPSKELARELLPQVESLNLKLILEPGRRIAGNAGVLLTKVIYKKTVAGKTLYIVDAGMNDLPRPALYGALHHIVPATAREGKTTMAGVVGPVCESSDTFAECVELPAVEEGDILAILSAGAYCFSMASNYNSRPRPPEVLVSAGKAKLIRQRETLADLIAREIL